MKIEIHSFQSALTLKPSPQEKNIMIRISDPDYIKERDAELWHQQAFVGVLKVSFHDLTDKQVRSILEKEPGATYCTINREQAMTIVSFVERNQDCDKVVIHCSAGISRSSAVAIGIARFLNDGETEKKIRENEKYTPNETVINRMIEAINLKNSLNE